MSPERAATVLSLPVRPGTSRMYSCATPNGRSPEPDWTTCSSADVSIVTKRHGAMVPPALKLISLLKLTLHLSRWCGHGPNRLARCNSRIGRRGHPRRDVSLAGHHLCERRLERDAL